MAWITRLLRRLSRRRDPADCPHLHTEEYLEGNMEFRRCRDCGARWMVL
jgi:hypothetical protein